MDTKRAHEPADDRVCNGEAPRLPGESAGYDYDWLVIGSGFGGSVSALRLAEKGYRVGVLEAGRRFRDEDLPRTTWDARNFNWLPTLGLRGILRLTTFKDVFIASGRQGTQASEPGLAGALPAALPLGKAETAGD